MYLTHNVSVVYYKIMHRPIKISAIAKIYQGQRCNSSQFLTLSLTLSLSQETFKLLPLWTSNLSPYKNLPSIISSLMVWISILTSARSSCFHASSSEFVAARLALLPKQIVSWPVSDWKRRLKQIIHCQLMKSSKLDTWKFWMLGKYPSTDTFIYVVITAHKNYSSIVFSIIAKFFLR